MKIRRPSATSIVAMLMVGLLGGCGTVGLPVAPGNAGVEATIKQQKRLEKLELLRERKAAAGSELPDLPLEQLLLLEEQGMDLPPLRPVGTR
ncbi:MAG: hypothetical protein JW388_0382 [Nitrospira sp.]|nr:hypothetical protein [Nitrospira sp.]